MLFTRRVFLAVPLLAAQPPYLSALRGGGFNIAMRHASSPGKLPTKETADAANTALERQLDNLGRTSATAFGAALRTLRIPIGEVLTSPTYRARETARLAQLPNPRTVEELGDGGQSMQRATEIQAAFLIETCKQPPPKRTNRILISHSTNLSGAFPAWTSNIAEGEALILKPGKPELIARVKISEWAEWAR